MLTGFRYRLSLTDEQAQRCVEYGAICRAVWNTALDQRREAVRRWRRGHAVPFCGYHLQARELAEAKTEEEWLKAAPSHILQQTLRDLGGACRRHGTLKVRWLAKGRWRPSFRFPDGPRLAVERLVRRWGAGEAAQARVGAVPVVPRAQGRHPVGDGVLRWPSLVRLAVVRGR